VKKKIVITGGLGYLGTELCRLYSGISWKHDITVIDSRFLSERINELKNWNIKFIQGAILDKNLINKELKNEIKIHHFNEKNKAVEFINSETYQVFD
jgi:UDP-glucose 4-epimerase